MPSPYPLCAHGLGKGLAHDLPLLVVVLDVGEQVVVPVRVEELRAWRARVVIVALQVSWVAQHTHACLAHTVRVQRYREVFGSPGRPRTAGIRLWSLTTTKFIPGTRNLQKLPQRASVQAAATGSWGLAKEDVVQAASCKGPPALCHS